MIWISAALLVGAGALFIIRKRDITFVQKALIGARLPDGCAVAEGVLFIALALLLVILQQSGFLG